MKIVGDVSATVDTRGATGVTTSADGRGAAATTADGIGSQRFSIDEDLDISESDTDL